MRQMYVHCIVRHRSSICTV